MNWTSKVKVNTGMEVVRVVVLQLSHYYPSDYVGRDKLGQSSSVGLISQTIR